MVEVDKRREARQKKIEACKEKTLDKRRVRDTYDKKEISSHILRKDIGLESLNKMLDFHLGRLGLDPLHILFQTVHDSSTPLLNVHKTAWAMCRLLILQAGQRTQHEANNPENADKPLTVFNFTKDEVDTYVKLCKTVIESKNALINVRKQKITERELEKSAAETALPVYSQAEIDVLTNMARTGSTGGEIIRQCANTIVKYTPPIED